MGERARVHVCILSLVHPHKENCKTQKQDTKSTDRIPGLQNCCFRGTSIKVLAVPSFTFVHLGEKSRVRTCAALAL